MLPVTARGPRALSHHQHPSLPTRAPRAQRGQESTHLMGVQGTLWGKWTEGHQPGTPAASGRYGLLAAPEADKCCPPSFASFNNFSHGAPFPSHRDCSDPRAWEPGREEGSCLPRLLKLIGGGGDLSREKERAAGEHCSAETPWTSGER